VNHLFCFGFGFSAQALAQKLDAKHWRISGTSRAAEGAAAIDAKGFEGLLYEELKSIPDSVTHIVSSVPPDKGGDPVLKKFGVELAARAKTFKWVAYLSTTGVYGDRAGALVDETSELKPNTDRGQRRVEAEAAWAAIPDLPLQIFRLAGIYGPGRNVLINLRDGSAKRVIKSGQIFSRIHVADIAGILLASLANPNPGRVYNVADDEPCPPQDVVTFGASLLGIPPPPEIPFEKAELSPMARSFYADSKRVSNACVKDELGYEFIYPNYRSGLRALL
jgi:nucleoside-diphosphate-sugar epimerase